MVLIWIATLFGYSGVTDCTNTFDKPARSIESKNSDRACVSVAELNVPDDEGPNRGLLNSQMRTSNYFQI